MERYREHRNNTEQQPGTTDKKAIVLPEREAFIPVRNPLWRLRTILIPRVRVEKPQHRTPLS